MTQLHIDIAIEAEQWPDEEQLRALLAPIASTVQNWLSENYHQKFRDQGSELSLVFIDDAGMQAINQQWRNIDKPTNVLSFPSLDMDPGDMPGPVLGDIIFAYETIAREADERRISLNDHLIHMFIHGFLHLFGYDHIHDDDAQVMESIETSILLSLDLSNPYG